MFLPQYHLALEANAELVKLALKNVITIASIWYSNSLPSNSMFPLA